MRMDTAPEPAKALRDALIRLDRSGAWLGRQCGVTTNAVWKWLNGGTISAERAVQIEAVMGGVVTRSDLRPDLFGPSSTRDRHTDAVAP